MAQTARVGTPSKVQNLVLYWPPYKAQLMLHSSIEANTCAPLVKVETLLKKCNVKGGEIKI